MTGESAFEIPTSSIEVQSIEYQVEHRFRFGISAAELDDLIAAIAAAGEWREFPFQDDPPEAFARCRRAIVETADPFRRGIEPLWSRGPYLIGAYPFPES